MTSEDNRSNYTNKSIRENYYIYGIVEYILPVFLTFIKKKSVLNRSVAYRETYKERMTINSNNNNYNDTTTTDTDRYESSNEETIDRLTTEIDRLSQELAALQVEVKHLRSNRVNTGGSIKSKKRRSGDVRADDTVRVLSSYRG